MITAITNPLSLINKHQWSLTQSHQPQFSGLLQSESTKNIAWLTTKQGCYKPCAFHACATKGSEADGAASRSRLPQQPQHYAPSLNGQHDVPILCPAYVITNKRAVVGGERLGTKPFSGQLSAPNVPCLVRHLCVLTLRLYKQPLTIN